MRPVQVSFINVFHKNNTAKCDWCYTIDSLLRLEFYAEVQLLLQYYKELSKGLDA